MRNCSLLFRRGRALQNPLITAIIFDIALSRDLRQLQTSPDTGEGGEAEGWGEQYGEVKFLFFFFSLPFLSAAAPSAPL